MPLPRIELRKGGFGFVRVELRLLEKASRGVRFSVKVTDTVDLSLINEYEVVLIPGQSLGTRIGGQYPFLEPLVLQRVEGEGDDLEAFFENGTSILVGASIVVVETSVAEGILREIEATRERLPLPNVVERVARATGLTRQTVFSIWKRFPTDKKSRIFMNPEGFIDRFSKLLRDVVGDFVANNLQFVKGEGGKLGGGRGGKGALGEGGVPDDATTVSPTTTIFSEPVEEAFPDPAKAVPSELVPAGDRSLYDAVQAESGVEERFVTERLEDDRGPVRLYFRFPVSFKIRLPKVIGGNYNPDWAICIDRAAGKAWIVRETKGNEDILKLRFSSEARKIVCGYKYFQALGIDYRAIQDDTTDWHVSAASEYRIGS
jgi:type III restriction enzyme